MHGHYVYTILFVLAYMVGTLEIQGLVSISNTQTSVVHVYVQGPVYGYSA